eukprot:15084446-Ditylum_brightwellii.AAC.1
MMLERGVDLDSDGVVLASEVDKDKLQFEGDETTLRPFGKAIYRREADYFVYPIPFIIFYTFIIKTLNATIHAIPLMGALHATAGILYGFSPSERNYDDRNYSF